MKLNTSGKPSFFSQESSPVLDETIGACENSQAKREQAARAIQRWWKQLHLRQTAIEYSQFVHHVVSIEQAQFKSFSTLEGLVLDKDTQAITRNLLIHVEQMKDVVLSPRRRTPDVPGIERIFLSAYLIVTKPEYLFESPSKIDAHLIAQAEQMILLFEKLCAFMSEIYSDKRAVSGDPILSVEGVFANLEASQRGRSYERRNNDACFMDEGRVLLQIFHQSQMAYYEIFTKWERHNRTRLANICILEYLEMESKRFVIINDPDSRPIEIYEAFGRQQDSLKKRINYLVGDEGLTRLEENLQDLHAGREANKWEIAPAESLNHEIAINPEFVLPSESCVIQPSEDIDAGIEALLQEPPDIEPILDVLEEVGRNMVRFIPHPSQQNTEFEQDVSRREIKQRIETMGLQEALYATIHLLIERIKIIECLEHVSETIAFQDKLDADIRERGGSGVLLKEAVAFIYQKLSQIYLETRNYQIDQARGFIARNIVALEQEKFQERLSGNQYNLALVLGWVDKIVESPEAYRCNIPMLCSRFVGSHVAYAIFLGVLQQSDSSLLSTIPETFSLDRVRMMGWHTQYKKIFCTVVLMGYIETLSAKYGIKLSSDELYHQKNRLMMILDASTLNTPKEIAQHLIMTLNEILIRHKKRLESLEEKTLQQLIEEICLGRHSIAKIIHRRLGDQLSSVLLKGHLPDASQSRIKWYGLEKEINQLGQEIFPVLRLHTKVYGAFYQQQVEARLWKPLFVTLRETQMSHELSFLLSTEKDSIEKLHASIHKMVLVLSGLALIQQMVAHADMWNLKVIMKNTIMKELAYSFGLMDMVNDFSVSKDTIEERLMALMEHVAREQKLLFDADKVRQMAKLLNLAKKEQSPGAKAFLDELLAFYKQTMTQNKEVVLNPRNLMAEFEVEVKKIGVGIKEIIATIKRDQMPEDRDLESQMLPASLRSGSKM